MSQIIINGQPLYQADLPEMTMAEYLDLPAAERPKEWIRTDAEYTDIPSENISYGSGSVKDALDKLTNPNVYTTITKNEVSCPNNGTVTVVGSFTLPKGVWLVHLYGYAPIMSSGNKVEAQVTQISIGNVGSQSLTYRFSICGIANLSDDSVCDVSVRNWESSVLTSTTNYSLKAIKIG